jgi:hypothetical protein
VRSWWRRLYGVDSNLDDEHLREMAGTFSRRLHAFCRGAGARRKHELAQPYEPNDPKFCGLFFVIKSNAPAPVWEVKRKGEGRITEIRHRKNWPYVRHFYFHLIDQEWGPNPIGTSIVLLVGIEGPVVLVRGLDCVDGTPLLDLKPDRTLFTPIAPAQAGDFEIGDL